jgi:hypothetical protein
LLSKNKFTHFYQVNVVESGYIIICTTPNIIFILKANPLETPETGIIFTPIDFFTAFFGFLVFTGIAYVYQTICFIDKPYLKKVFVLSLSLRLISALLSTLISQYYYGYGDTFSYHYCSSQIYDAFFTKTDIGLELLFGNIDTYSVEASKYANWWFFDNPSTALPSKIAALFGILSFNSYILKSFFFSTLSFIGCWQIFIIFYKRYPSLYKKIALTTLFMPSVVFWGSGLLKDPLCIFGLGILFYSTIEFYKRESLFFNITCISVGIYILYYLKLYILIAYLVGMFFYFISNLNKKTTSKIIKYLLFLSCFAFIIIIVQISKAFLIDTIGDPSLLLEQVEMSQSAQVINSYGGSGYTIETKPDGLINSLKLFFESTIIALYRPFIFEPQKIISLPASLENTAFLIYTLYTFYKVGFLSFFRIILKNELLIFCLSFTLVLAPVVGFASFNFGTLVRYKIPCLPFFLMTLILVNYKYSLVKRTKNTRMLPKNWTGG